MDVMLTITTRESGPIAVPLMQALSRAGVTWGCFFTNDGVELILDDVCQMAVKSAQRAVICEHSWAGASIGGDCPVELGSQTINSAMMTEAGRVVSL